MALSFMKKAAATSQGAAVNISKAKPTALPGSFLKKGAYAKAAIEQAEAAAEMAKAEAGKMWRFYIKQGEDRRITFLDGDINEEGMVDAATFWEHVVPMNGGWANFVCTAEEDASQPCPLCAAGNQKRLVGALTVIDHTDYKIKNGPKAGEVIKNQRKLFVATRQQLAVLKSLAEKRGGLAGCTFDVIRIGEKSSNTGSQFDFVEKFDSGQELCEKYGLTEEDIQPANYQEEITYRSPEELIELGLGKAIIPASSNVKQFNKAALAKEM